jgi:hypothetical protein
VTLSSPPPEPIPLIGDAEDPAYTLKALRARLAHSPARLAVLTVEQYRHGLLRHGWILDTADGLCAVEAAFLSGYGGQGASALAQSLKMIARQRVPLHWLAGWPAWEAVNGGEAACREWLALSHPLWVRVNHREETFAAHFAEAEGLLHIETGKGRPAWQDPRQLRLFEG